MAEDDTTPIALRRWLLRSSHNTTRLKSTTKSAVLRRLVAFICAAGLAWHLCTFENAADLRFFGGIGIALDTFEKQSKARCKPKILIGGRIDRVSQARYLDWWFLTIQRPQDAPTPQHQ